MLYAIKSYHKHILVRGPARLRRVWGRVRPILGLMDAVFPSITARDCFHDLTLIVTRQQLYHCTRAPLPETHTSIQHKSELMTYRWPQRLTETQSNIQAHMTPFRI
jgi:hypothetical protein